MKKACIACPFRDGENEEATQAQNYACLPSWQDMLDYIDTHKRVISCHNNDQIPCIGAAKYRNVQNIPITPYSEWYRKGLNHDPQRTNT